MATYLADTNLLLRLADPASSQHSIATDALARLFGRGDEVFLTPQNLIEFWAVATRPVEANGFGWNSERTAQEVAELQDRFPLLPDSPDIFTRWLELVKKLPVHGKRVHDARLVAVLQAHAVHHLITLNTSDFTAFPSLAVVDPRSLVTAAEQ
ncbi:MAG: type II toxin-antitoxin system VapC family toxin [Verrucomicrobiales bacterium]|nr:type II toxin-antitoxin system VapC family toxin [Verrucomicrobiales bacterium]